MTVFMMNIAKSMLYKELKSYLVIEHPMELIKLEAHRQLRQHAPLEQWTENYSLELI